jgi:hypothetical protein
MSEEGAPAAKEQNRQALKQEEHNRDVSKLFFEYFKHFTTLTTATAVVEVALYEHLGVDTIVLIVGLLMLGMTLGFSLAGMYFVPTRMSVQRTVLQEDSLSFTQVLMFVTGFFFVVALWAFIAGAVGIGAAWAAVIGSAIAFGATGLLLRTVLYQS